MTQAEALDLMRWTLEEWGHEWVTEVDLVSAWEEYRQHAMDVATTSSG